MLSFIAWCFFGGIVGWLSGLVVNGDVPGDGGRNVVAGVAGALFGGLVLPWNIAPNLLSMGSLFMAFTGAVAFTAASGWFAGSRAHR